MCVRARARVASLQLSLLPLHPTPHPTAPGQRAAPAPLCWVRCRLLRSGPAPPSPARRPPVRPGFKGPALQLQPLRGAGRRRGWCGSQKSWSPQPASPAQGWAACSEVCDRRSQLLAGDGTQPASCRPRTPTAGGRGPLCPARAPFRSHRRLSSWPGAPLLIGVHGAGAVAPFRVHSNLRRR